ncbi:MAG TPA: hypothetical protein PLL06_16755 [Acidobacteriota bacterium]|nr:hypothetical protein [Acidobacteriota bacterium]HMZ81355.1 hypothetical protein [Acidobacteriota bacterium]HNB72929.1 hypothetical protein [Acidobacteriota bacterium]HND18342.1 hypothetical protein [Acidobacteriota bacterium]HNG92720.1 hypothetical protein [Acidobacteriota bacterium]
MHNTLRTLKEAGFGKLLKGIVCLVALFWLGGTVSVLAQSGRKPEGQPSQTKSKPAPPQEKDLSETDEEIFLDGGLSAAEGFAPNFITKRSTPLTIGKPKTNKSQSKILVTPTRPIQN